MMTRLMVCNNRIADVARPHHPTRPSKHGCMMLLFVVTIGCVTSSISTWMPFSAFDASRHMTDRLWQPGTPRSSAFSYEHVGSFGMGHVPDPANTAINGSGCFYTTSLNVHAVYVHSAEGKFLFRWGEYGTGPGQFSMPWGITVTNTGLVYVSDTQNDRVQVFTQDGEYVDVMYGFDAPHALTCDIASNIYVADLLNSRIAMFNSNRQLIRYMAVPHPLGVATNASGFVYATSIDTDTVYVFNSTGHLVHQWSQEMYWGATGLTVNGTGHVFVGAINHASVRAFTQNGTYLFSFQAGHLNVRGVNVALDGNIWVTDDYGIRNYSSNGTYISSIGTMEDIGTTFNPDGIAINGTGHVFLVDYYNRIQAFHPNGTFLCRWDTFNGVMFSELHDIAISPGGNIYVTGSIPGGESSPTVVVAFDASREYLLNWTVAYEPHGIAINSTGAVYVTDGESNVHVYDAIGTPVTQWSTGVNSGPKKLAINGTGHVYVPCMQDNLVRVYDAGGQLVTSWGGAGNDTGQFNSPSGMCINASGHVFVADTGNNRVQAFTPDGLFLHAWGSFGCGDEEIIQPRDVATGIGGRFYVTDTYLDTGNYYNNRVQMFGNSPPSVKNALITPSTPNGADDLRLHYSYEDAQGDPEVKSMLQVRWYRNWVLQPAFNDATVIPASHTNITDVWYAVVSATDGRAYSDPVTTPVQPVASYISIAPQSPCTNDSLVLSYDYSDVSGETELGTEVRWYRNGILFPACNDQLVVPSEYTNKSEWWHATVRPRNDRGTYGAIESVAAVRIRNLAPAARNVTITPASPAQGNSLHLSYTFADYDCDQEGTSIIRWFRNDIPAREYDDMLVVAGASIKPGDRWYATVRPFDGDSFGTLETAPVVVVSNDPPQISHHAPLAFTSGTIGNHLAWNITDTTVNSPTFTIYHNNTIILVDQPWQPGMQVRVQLDGYAAGTHVFKIVAHDGAGASVSDEVTVTITEAPGGIDMGLTLGLISIAGQIIPAAIVVAILLAGMIKASKDGRGRKVLPRTT